MCRLPVGGAAVSEARLRDAEPLCPSAGLRVDEQQAPNAVAPQPKPKAKAVSSGAFGAGRKGGNGVTERVVWRVVKECAQKAAIGNLAPHDLHRTRARLCRDAGGELEQIQFLLGHVSVQTTERYLGCKQRLQNAVNDRIGIEPRTEHA
nr:site-specific integrase [uncultured Paludibaculum sp.]